MSRIRSRDTKPELQLRSALFERGLRFRVRSALKGKPDIIFTRARLVVFVDGCFWHGCPEHGTKPKSNTAYWLAKIEKNRARDLEVSASLTADGWRVVRYWDHNIRGNIESVAKEIETIWQSLTAGA